MIADFLIVDLGTQRQWLSISNLKSTINNFNNQALTSSAAASSLCFFTNLLRAERNFMKVFASL
jgi:hypothetical protein